MYISAQMHNRLIEAYCIIYFYGYVFLYAATKICVL